MPGSTESGRHWNPLSISQQPDGIRLEIEYFFRPLRICLLGLDLCMKAPWMLLLLTAAVSGAAFGDSSPVVLMSGNVITTSIPAITFTLRNDDRHIARTRVYTMSGQEVAELSAQSVNRFTWDGKDVDEQPVEPGLYVVQIHQGDAFWHSRVIVNR